MNEFVLKLLVNATWQIPLCGVLAWCAALTLRRWPMAWTAWCWRAAVAFAAVLPTLTAVGVPYSPQGGIQIPLPSIEASAVPGSASEAGLSWLTFAYLTFVSIMAIRLVRQWWALRQLNEDNVATPVAIGWRRPTVILPVRFVAEASEMAKQAAVAHEATHLRHQDFLYNLILEAITIPVSFHPAIFWMKRRTANAVEMRCDEQAALEIGNAKEYVLGLIEAARFLGAPPSPRLTASFFDHSSFEERVMNLTLSKSMPRRWARVTAAATLAAATLFLAGFSASFAAQQGERIYKIGEDGVQSPNVTKKVEPTTPPSSTATGTTILTLEISPKGKPENVEVSKSLEVEFDQAAIAAIKQWEFNPAMKDGQPVRVKATIEVNFRRK